MRYIFCIIMLYSHEIGPEAGIIKEYLSYYTTHTHALFFRKPLEQRISQFFYIDKLL